jgi:predicted metalloprotease
MTSSSKIRAPGDFAQAYVIAHEIGHHVQNLLGIERQVRDQRSGTRKTDAYSVRALQADCYAASGPTMPSAADTSRAGDPEALNAAASVGDDRIQRNAGARVSPILHPRFIRTTHDVVQARAAGGDIGQCVPEPQ